MNDGDQDDDVDAVCLEDLLVELLIDNRLDRVDS